MLGRLWKSASLATGIVIPLLATGLLAASGITHAKDSEAVQKLRAVVDSPARSTANKARDPYRHPVETLAFFGIKPNMTVVELWPFGGWFTEILAPYVRDHGKLYAAAMDPASTSKNDLKYNSDLRALFDTHPELFDKVQLTVLSPNKMEIAPDGSADMVVTFRNIHNWAWAGIDKKVFAAAFRALKPGGILGIEEHRNNDPNFAPSHPPQAYVGEKWAIGMIESVGFKFVADSDINRNPKDTKDYPKGVWTLPPYYAEGDKDRETYTAIGESDRFLLKFVKPR